MLILKIEATSEMRVFLRHNLFKVFLVDFFFSFKVSLLTRGYKQIIIFIQLIIAIRMKVVKI